MNITERLLSLIPYETKIIRPIYNGTNLEDIEVTDVDNINSPEEVVCNLLLTALLKCYGVDVSTVIHEFIEETDYRLVILRPIIECMTTRDKTMPYNDSTITLRKYLYKKHGVKNFPDLANLLYSELSNSLYITNQKITAELEPENLITITKECNEICHTLAVCIANNDMFDMGITMPEHSLQDWDDTIEIINTQLKNLNLLADNGSLTVLPNIVDKARENNLNYITFGYVQAVEDSYLGWEPFFIFTKDPLLTFRLELSSYGTITICDIHATDRNGTFPISTTSPTYAYWATIPERAITTFTLNGADHELVIIEQVTNHRHEEHVDMYYTCNADNRLGVQYAYQSKFFVNNGRTYQTHSYRTLMLNGSLTGELSDATISNRTRTNLESDNIKLISASPVPDYEFLKLNATNILDIVGLLTDPLNGGDALNTAVIDPTLNVSLNDGVSNTEAITADFVAQYKDLWTNQVDELYKNGAVYNYYTFKLTSQGLGELMSIYWEESFWDEKLGNTARDSTLKLYALPYELESDEYNLPVTISVGNYMSTGVQGSQVMKTRHVIESPPVYVPRKFKSFLDYAPNVKAMIYLPFVGLRQLDPSLIVGCLVTIRYEISNITGEFVVSVLSGNKTDYSNNYHGVPIFMETGCMAYDLPVIGRENNATNLLASIAAVIGGIATTATGNPLGLLGMTGGIKQGIDYAAGTIQNASLSGQSDSSWITNYSPYIILTYKEPIHSWNTAGTAFDKTIGKISQQGIYIKNCSAGYHEVDSVKVDGLRCTEEERKEIEEIIMGGFYYGSVDMRSYE